MSCILLLAVKKVEKKELKHDPSRINNITLMRMNLGLLVEVLQSANPQEEKILFKGLLVLDSL